jgi:hypothetical protein
MAVLYISLGWTRNWLLSQQVDLGEDGTTEKLVGVIMDMTNGVAVGEGPGVECYIIDAGTFTIVLGHDV